MNNPLNHEIERRIFSKYTAGSVFEWGGSSISEYYSQYSKSWTCVVYDREAYDMLRSKPTRVDYILKEPNYEYTKYQPAEYGQFKDYANAINHNDDKYDTIILHGRDRVSCAKEAIKHLKESGVIIVYDFWNRSRYHSLLDDFEVVDGFNDGRFEHTAVALKRKSGKKKKLLIYTGYSANNWNSGSLYEFAVGGSELATARVAREFAKIGYDVVVSGQVRDGVGEDGVRYLHLGEGLQEYLNRNKLDVVIVSRYLHFITQYKFQSDYLYLLLHDVVYLPWGIRRDNPHRLETRTTYPDEIHENYISRDRFDGVICLTNWHLRNYNAVYPYSRGKVHVWGNAINPESFPTSNIPKIKDSFIWASRAIRGLRTLLDMWPDIKKKIPGATLNIYTYNTEGEEDVIVRCSQLDGVTHHGGVPQSVLLEKIKETEYWFYPTNFSETYCITALEMQYSRVTCVCTNLAALMDTVGDRGVTFNIPKEGYDSEEYKKIALDSLFKLYDNQALRLELLDRAEEWAKKQTWRNRAIELDQYFKSVATNKYNKWRK